MRPRDIIDLPLPGAIWGSSNPFLLLAYTTIYLTAGFAARRST